MANYELSNRIYELRTKKGLSQKELGAILGVSNKAVSKWETGTAIPKTETLIKLAEVFEISTEELINGVCKDDGINTDRKNENQRDTSINTNEKSPKEMKKYFLKVSFVFDIIFSLIGVSVTTIATIGVNIIGNIFDYDLTSDYAEVVTWTLIWSSTVCTVGYVILGKYLTNKSRYTGGFDKHKFLYCVVPSGAVSFISSLATTFKFVGSEYVGDVSNITSTIMSMLLYSVSIVATIIIMSSLMINSVEQDAEKSKKLFKTLAIIVTISSLARYILGYYIDYAYADRYNEILPLKDVLSLYCNIAIVWLVYFFKGNNPKREKIIYTILPLISIWAPAVLYALSRIVRYI